MKNNKDKIAKVLAEWLSKDFGILIEPPTELEIAKSLENHIGKEKQSSCR